MPQTNGYKSIGDTSELGFLNKNQSCMAGWHCGYGTDRYKCPVSNTVQLVLSGTTNDVSERRMDRTQNIG